MRISDWSSDVCSSDLTLRRLGQSPRVIILRLRLMPLLDASGAQALEEFIEQARLAGAEVILSGVQPPPRSKYGRIGLGATAMKPSYAADYAGSPVLAVEMLGQKGVQFRAFLYAKNLLVPSTH